MYHSVNRWALTGGSKRGWTAWLAAAVDYHRVKLTAPVVLSFLNMIENFHHYWRYEYLTRGFGRSGRVRNHALIWPISYGIQPFFNFLKMSNY